MLKSYNHIQPVTFAVFYRLEGSHKTSPPSRGEDYARAKARLPEGADHGR